MVLKTGNGTIQTGNGIISPISRPLIKNFFYKMFLNFANEFKLVLKTGNRTIQTGNGIISPNS